jgi:predicted nucleic acid-binding protein
MATYLLDTSVIIDAINGKKKRRQFLRDLLQQGNLLACCPVNITEVYAGLRPAEEENTVTFLKTLQMYSMTWPVAELAGLLKRDYSKKGTTLNLGDVIIAATALHNSLILLTDSTKDFPMNDLSLYSLPNHLN